MNPIPPEYRPNLYEHWRSLFPPTLVFREKVFTLAGLDDPRLARHIRLVETSRLFPFAYFCDVFYDNGDRSGLYASMTVPADQEPDPNIVTDQIAMVHMTLSDWFDSHA